MLGPKALFSLNHALFLAFGVTATSFEAVVVQCRRELRGVASWFFFMVRGLESRFLNSWGRLDIFFFCCWECFLHLSPSHVWFTSAVGGAARSLQVRCLLGALRMRSSVLVSVVVGTAVAVACRLLLGGGAMASLDVAVIVSMTVALPPSVRARLGRLLRRFGCRVRSAAVLGSRRLGRGGQIRGASIWLGRPITAAFGARLGRGRGRVNEGSGDLRGNDGSRGAAVTASLLLATRRALGGSDRRAAHCTSRVRAVSLFNVGL